MGYNSKQLKSEPLNKKKTNPYKGDVIIDPMGQWAHPGEITKIPSGNITMNGVNYPVLGIDDQGNHQMMYPNQDYQFPGNSVTEYPQVPEGYHIMPDGSLMSDSEMEEYKRGGLVRGFTNKNVKTSINELMKRNESLFGPKGKYYYNPVMKKKKNGGTPEAFPQQPTAREFFEKGFIPQSPVGFYKHGGSPGLAFPQQPTADIFFGALPWTPHFQQGGSSNPYDSHIQQGITSGIYSQPKDVSLNYIQNTNKFGTGLVLPEGAIGYTRYKTSNFSQDPGVKNNAMYYTDPDSGYSYYPRYAPAQPTSSGSNTSTVNNNGAIDNTNINTPVVIPGTPSGSSMNNTNENTSYQTPFVATPQEHIMSYAEWQSQNVVPSFLNGGQPCYDCGGQHMETGGWIQDATKNMRTDKPCTGSKFGGPDCPPGSKRYNLAKTFRAMAKKQFGGDTNDQQIINQMDEDDYIGNYSKTFMDKLRTNTISSIADEASDNVNQANQEFFAQFGMEVPNNYGYNPNMMGQKMYGDKADYMENQGANAINNFYNTSMDIASNANPYMAMSFMQDGGIPTGMSQDQFFAYMDAYNQRNQGQNTTPNYQSQWTPQNQGMNYFPMNSSPYIKWNTPRPQNRTQGYPVPNVQFNPQNTYLQSFDYKGRLLGPGARKVSMTFRTYIDPITGQPTQVPVENTGAIGTGTNNTPMVNPNIDVNPSGTPTMTPSGVPITPISGNQLSLIPEKNFDDFQLDKPFNNPPFTQDNSNYLTPQERKKRDNLPGDLRSMFMNLQQNKQERFNRKNPPRESAVHPGFLQYGGIPKAQFGMNAFGQPDNQFQGPLSPDFVNQNTQGFMPANTPDEQANYFDTTITGKRKMGFEPEASANWLLASITGATALANRGEQAKTEEEMQRLTLADNVFNPMPANRIQNQGRYNWTGMSSGMMDPNSMGVIQQPGQNYTGMYKQGGEYELSEDEINYIMKNGGSITYL